MATRTATVTPSWCFTGANYAVEHTRSMLAFNDGQLRSHLDRIRDLHQRRTDPHSTAGDGPYIQSHLRSVEQYLRSIRQRKAYLAELLKRPPVEPIELAPALEKIRALPAVLDARYVTNRSPEHIQITFVPAAIHPLPTTPITLSVINNGGCWGQEDVGHPHIKHDEICWGDAGTIRAMCEEHNDLLGWVSVFNEMYVGHNPASELNHSWQYHAYWFWHHVAHEPQDDTVREAIDLGWDGQTIQTPEGELTTVTQFYGKPLTELVAGWDAYQYEDDPDEDEDSEWLGDCVQCQTSCHENDDAHEWCEVCGDLICDSWHCLRNHMADAHDLSHCYEAELYGVRRNCEQFGDSWCEPCDQYFCEACLTSHEERDYHQAAVAIARKEEQKEELAHNILDALDELIELGLHVENANQPFTRRTA